MHTKKSFSNEAFFLMRIDEDYTWRKDLNNEMRFAHAMSKYPATAPYDNKGANDFRT
jgi:hypothetical protein